MCHGEFYRSEQLVELLDANSGLFGLYHPDARAIHDNGRLYAGCFTATAEARGLSRAAHFQGAPVPVTARLSLGSMVLPVAMAARFYLPNGTITNLVAITLPAFPARTPDEVIELLQATLPDPATGKADPAKLQAFYAGHPAAVTIGQLVRLQPAPVSIAQTSFRPLHAFRFVNAADEGRWARYHWEPEAGSAGQPQVELLKLGHNHLFDEFDSRLQRGAVGFRLELQLAQDDDPVDDISALWADDRERVVVGRLELTRAVTREELGDPLMVHDPTVLTDGIELSLDDQIIAARRGVYTVAAAGRGGAWQDRAPALAQGCPFHGP